MRAWIGMAGFWLDSFHSTNDRCKGDAKKLPTISWFSKRPLSVCSQPCAKHWLNATLSSSSGNIVSTMTFLPRAVRRRPTDGIWSAPLSGRPLRKILASWSPTYRRCGVKCWRKSEMVNNFWDAVIFWYDWDVISDTNPYECGETYIITRNNMNNIAPVCPDEILKMKSRQAGSKEYFLRLTTSSNSERVRYNPAAPSPSWWSMWSKVTICGSLIYMSVVGALILVGLP